MKIRSPWRRRLLAPLCALLLTACSQGSDPVELFRSGNFSRAFTLFSAQAEGGDMAAVNFLGIHYYLGAGVPRDFTRAFDYFRQAALENNADAQRNLAIMYMRGLGTPQDNHSAYGWFFQAYSGGNPNAREYLRMLSDNVTPNAGGKAREEVARLVREHAQNKR